MAHETKGDEPLASLVRVLVAALVLALASLAAGVAGAATLSDTPSAVDQYVEIVPTGNGNATRGDKSTPLSRGSARTLGAVGGPMAAALREVATSPAFGAPEAKLALPKNAQVISGIPNASFAGSLKEVAGSLLSGGGRPLGLLVALTAISLAAAALARRKRSAS